MEFISDVPASGNWAEDCARGREYGAALVAHIRVTGNVPLLGRVIGAMRGDQGRRGVEAGVTAVLAASMM